MLARNKILYSHAQVACFCQPLPATVLSSSVLPPAACHLAVPSSAILRYLWILCSIYCTLAPRMSVLCSWLEIPCVYSAACMRSPGGKHAGLDIKHAPYGGRGQHLDSHSTRLIDHRHGQTALGLGTQTWATCSVKQGVVQPGETDCGREEGVGQSFLVSFSFSFSISTYLSVCLFALPVSTLNSFFFSTFTTSPLRHGSDHGSEG